MAGLQVFNRVIAPMSGQPGNEAVAADSEAVLRHALQVLLLPCSFTRLQSLHACVQPCPQLSCKTSLCCLDTERACRHAGVG